MNKAPTYIPIITGDSIILKNLNSELKRTLKENGFKLEKQHLIDTVIKYKSAPHDTLDSDLSKKLIELSKLGIAFSEDYKQGWAPADIMKDYQKKGILEDNFISIYWMSGQWKLKTHFTYIKYKNLKMNGTDIHEMNKIATTDGLDLVEKFDMFKAIFELSASEVKSELNKNQNQV